VVGLGAVGPWRTAPGSNRQVRSGNDCSRSKHAAHSVAHGHAVGRWSAVRRDRWVSRPGTVMNFLRIVLATIGPR